MRRLTCSCRIRSSSTSSARSRSSSMWTTRMRLRSGAELGKVCLLAALPLVASSSTCVFSRFSLLLAWWTPFPLNDCTNAALLSQYLGPWQPRTRSALSSLAHTFSKFVNSDELVGFFIKAVTEGARPWISRTYAYGLPTHVEAEVRGVVYVSWRGEWGLALWPMTPWSTRGNYFFLGTQAQ